MTHPMTNTLMNVMADSAAIEKGVDIADKSAGELLDVTFLADADVDVVADVVVVVVVDAGSLSKLFAAAGWLRISCITEAERTRKQDTILDALGCVDRMTPARICDTRVFRNFFAVYFFRVLLFFFARFRRCEMYSSC
jgi:hypothetical protein